jgi:hypothetical protein
VLREHLLAPALEAHPGLSSKQAALLRHIAALGPGQSVAVVCQGLAGARRLHRVLAEQRACAVFSLGGTDRSRAAVVRQWERSAAATGQTAVLLLPLTTLCAQTAGLNLQRAATAVYVLSPRHSLEDVHQTLGRFLRTEARVAELPVYVLLAADTIDTEEPALTQAKERYAAALALAAASPLTGSP